MNSQRKIGDVVLDVDNISLSFGGVNAIQDVSFDVREGEVRAIIGPNGAGKSSMLNCINGFYHPQHGSITYKGVKRTQMRTHDAAAQGIARTFQNIALFRGMTTLDNIMTGRNLKMKSNFFLQALHVGPARAQAIHGRKPLTGEQVRDGLEKLDITAARLKELGMEDFVGPLKITCADHESGGPVIIQQWDGKQWNMVSDWIAPMTEVIRPMIESAAAAYAKENNITPRTCS